MKKFLNTVLATAAVVAVTSSAVHADAVAKAAQGFYLGASAGMANTNVKYTSTASGTTTANGQAAVANTADYKNVNSHAGKSAGIFGLLGGYNFQSGSFVFGGEIYGGFDSTKVTVADDSSSGATADAATGTVSVKRTNFFGFAPRVGYMIAPNTLMYARLAVEAGKWKGTVTPNANAINSNVNTVAGTSAAITAQQIADSKAVVNTSKGGVSFAPGLGMEVYMGKAFLRAQYSYLFGPKLNMQQNMSAYGQASYAGQYNNHSLKMTQHKVEVAVGYKF